MAYEATAVPVEKSQSEIRGLLSRHHATQFAFGEETASNGRQWAAVSFSAQGYVVRMRVPHKEVDHRALMKRLQRARSKTKFDLEYEMREREAKRIWRVLAWNLKARLVAVEEQVETFAEAFLAHLINPATGRTVYEQLSEDGNIHLPSPLLALPAGDEGVER
jgi:hypothetical protein